MSDIEFTFKEKHKKGYSDHYQEWIEGDLYEPPIGGLWIGRPNGVKLVNGGKGMEHIKVNEKTITSMTLHRYTKLKIAHRKMSNFMYALLMTKSKLVGTQHLDLQRFTRNQNTGNMVDVVVEIDADKIKEFEELAGVELKSSKEFQGAMKINKE